MYQNKTVAVVIPALNEAPSIVEVVEGLKRLSNSDGQRLVDDIVVCDNASTDDTAVLARYAGARVVYEDVRGYGAACQAALAAISQADYVVFVDADLSVDISQLYLLLAPLAIDADLVIGSRSLGNSQAGALTLPQRIGTRLACQLIGYFWRRPVTDLGPFRAITRSALCRLNMQDRKFGWTVEMQVKAIQQGMNVVEVPVTTFRRLGQSKISGTFKGVVGAAIGIFATIFMLRHAQSQA
ncbi:MAG: glycosyltransferase family 2 protein [Halioglobus sp.]